MRILLWGLCSTPGGIEAFLTNYIHILNNLDKTIVFDSIGYTYPSNSDEIIQQGGKVFVIEGEKKQYLINFFKMHLYDFLWCNMVSLSDVEIIKIAKKYGVKRIAIHSHSSSMMSIGWRRYYHYIKHYINKIRISKYSTDFWACSDRAARWMFTKIDFKKNGLIIPNAIDSVKFRYNPEIRKKIRDENKWNNKFIMGYIGRLSEEKDPFFAVDVFDKLLGINKNSKLVFIGNPVLQEEVHSRALLLGVEQHVDFMGIRNDVNQLIQGIDAVVMTSNFEGFPMVAVEAQASGTPIFVAEEAVTKQVKIVDEIKFIKKSAGPQIWADIIYNYEVNKKDTYEAMKTSNYDISIAGKDLISLITKKDE